MVLHFHDKGYKLAYDALRFRWGKEFDDLPEDLQSLVLDDFMEAQVTSQVYMSRIWKGNLASYAICLAVGK